MKRILKRSLFFSAAFALFAVAVPSASAHGVCSHGYVCTVSGAPECGAIVYVFYDSDGNPIIVNSGYCCSCA